MLEIDEGPTHLDVASPLRWGSRLLFALLSLIPLLAPYELLWKVGWTAYWNLSFAFAAFVSAGAMAVSAFFVFAALAGRSTRMRFDATRSTFTYTEVAPVIPRRTRALPLASIARVEVRTHDWSDGDPSFALRIETCGGEAFDTASSPSRQDVESAKARVEAFLARAGHAGR
jgi:hypothetical protein